LRGAFQYSCFTLTLCFSVTLSLFPPTPASPFCVPPQKQMPILPFYSRLAPRETRPSPVAPYRFVKAHFAKSVRVGIHRDSAPGALASVKKFHHPFRRHAVVEDLGIVAFKYEAALFCECGERFKIQGYCRSSGWVTMSTNGFFTSARIRSAVLCSRGFPAGRWDEGEKDNVGIFQHLLRKVYCPSSAMILHSRPFSRRMPCTGSNSLSQNVVAARP